MVPLTLALPPPATLATKPPSDIVLGAILAADPSQYRAAADRLKRVGGETGSEFAASAVAPSGSANWRTSTAPETISADAQGQPATPAPAARAGRAGKSPDAFAQLEAFVLQS